MKQFNKIKSILAGLLAVSIVAIPSLQMGQAVMAAETATYGTTSTIKITGEDSVPFQYNGGFSSTLSRMDSYQMGSGLKSGVYYNNGERVCTAWLGTNTSRKSDCYVLLSNAGTYTTAQKGTIQLDVKIYPYSSNDADTANGGMNGYLVYNSGYRLIFGSLSSYSADGVNRQSHPDQNAQHLYFDIEFYEHGTSNRVYPKGAISLEDLDTDEGYTFGKWWAGKSNTSTSSSFLNRISLTSNGVYGTTESGNDGSEEVTVETCFNAENGFTLQYDHLGRYYMSFNYSSLPLNYQIVGDLPEGYTAADLTPDTKYLVKYLNMDMKSNTAATAYLDYVEVPGYTFSGWKLSSNATGADYSGTTLYDTETTLYGKYTKVEKESSGNIVVTDNSTTIVDSGDTVVNNNNIVSKGDTIVTDSGKTITDSGDTIVTTVVPSGDKIMDGDNIINTVIYDDDNDGIYHKMVSQTYVAPTCSNPGSMTYLCECGDGMTVVLNPTGNHNYQKVEAQSTEPTATANGKYVYKCESCTDTYTDTIPATGHQWSDWKVIGKTTKNGVTTIRYQATCKTCDETKLYTVEQPDADHDYVEDRTDKKDATCTNDGYVKMVCQDCGHSYYKVLPATGHDYSKDSIVSGDCDNLGYTTYKCQNCGDTQKQDYTSHTKHSYTKKVVNPTCKKLGYTKYTCEDCGYTYKTDYKMQSHQYTWKITKKATYISTGTKKKVCTGCGHVTDTVKLSKLTVKRPMSVQATVKNSTSVFLSWDKSSNADGYLIYGTTESHTPSLKKTIKGGDNTSCTLDGLKLGKDYKYYVVAYKVYKGKVVYSSRSISAHVAMPTTSSKDGNAKKITTTKSSYTLKVGKSAAIKAKLTIEDNKNSKSCVSKIRYYSTNSKVAIVNRFGTITAKKKGTCTVYAIAANGLKKAITVTVK